MRRIAVVLALLVVSGIELGTADPGEAASAKCGKKPFTGTVSRTAALTRSGQHAPVERKTNDFRSGVVFDFGTRKNYTVYVSEAKLDPKRLGSTLTAPAGKVLVTIFLRSASGADLRAGQRLDAAKDPLTVLVDSGGGAETTSSNRSGTASIVKLSDSTVCFQIDYRDDAQSIKGMIAAAIP